MARKKLTVGSVVKGQNGKPDYIKISRDVVLKQGEYLNLESKKQQLESAEAAHAAGKLSAEILEKIKARLEKMPDFVRFEISVLRETESK